MITTIFLALTSLLSMWFMLLRILKLTDELLLAKIDHRDTLVHNTILTRQILSLEQENKTLTKTIDSIFNSEDTE